MRTADPRHILIVAYHFPPSAAVGGRRALRFAHGLAESGMRTSVLTVDPSFHDAVDPNLLAEDTAPFRIVRTTTWDPVARLKARGGGPQVDGAGRAGDVPTARPRAGKLGALLRASANATRRALKPDTEIAWLPPALRAARALHAADPIDIVLATLPPRSTLGVGAAIARRTGARLVADYRDPWSADRETFGVGTAWERSLDARIERRWLRHAALVLFTSPTAREFYERTFSDLPRAEVLYNGIDRYVERPGELDTTPLTWAHAGSLYGGDRSLGAVVRAMARLRDQVTMRLLLIGDEPSEELALARSLGVESRVEWLGRLPFEQALALLARSHRLLAPIAAIHPHSIPGKLFDYFATRRPILLLSDPSHSAARLLQSIPAHRVLPADDVDGAAALIAADDAALRAGGLPDVERSSTAPYEAETQIRALRGWLEDL